MWMMRRISGFSVNVLMIGFNVRARLRATVYGIVARKRALTVRGLVLAVIYRCWR